MISKKLKKIKKNEKYKHCYIIPINWIFSANKESEQEAKCLFVNVDKTKIDIDFECKKDCCVHFEHTGRDGKKKKCEYIIND